MSSERELKYITTVVLPELVERLNLWHEEYKHQERDLGLRGEFAGLYRKVRKLKSTIWDGVNADAWREGTRTILFEVIAHAMLSIVDLDTEESRKRGGDPVRMVEGMIEMAELAAREQANVDKTFEGLAQS